MTARQFILQKTTVPSEMRSVQWARVALENRELAFFMAGVTSRTILEGFRGAVQAVVDGSMSEAEASRMIREALTKADYKPDPGQEGTIKDLRTLRRQMLVIQKNVALAHGRAAMLAQTDDIAHPATELRRSFGRKRPRLWLEQLWPNAVRARNAMRPDLPALRDDIMMAPVGDDVFYILSDFRAPYDPLKWGTGMRQRPVGYRRAKEAGILPERKPVQTDDGGDSVWVEPSPAAPASVSLPAVPGRPGPAVRPSPGEALEMEVPGAGEGFKRGLVEDLRGLGEWRGDTIVFTDPNGTRPYLPGQLAGIITRDNLDGTQNFQLAALLEWLRLGGGDAATLAMRQHFAGTDKLDDFNRLLWRMKRAAPATRAAELLTALGGAVLALL